MCSVFPGATQILNFKFLSFLLKVITVGFIAFSYAVQGSHLPTVYGIQRTEGAGGADCTIIMESKGDTVWCYSPRVILVELVVKS